MHKYVLSVVAALVLAGCSSTVEQTRYSLIEGVTPQAFDVEKNVKVTLTGALAEPGLVLRVSPVTVQAAKYHLWDMAPDEQLEILFNHELIKAGCQVAEPVRIWVSRFDGTPDGHVTVAAAMKAKGQNGQVIEKSVSWQGKQPRDGYEALAEALKEGFTQVATELVRELKVK